MIVPQYFDTMSINSSNPMCVLVAVGALCDTSLYMSPNSPEFPIRFEFTQGETTQHCRHYPMNKVTCKIGNYCPDKVTCNLKMNGSRKFKDWSWDCNSPSGKVHYESCYGNRDISCVNVGSFHFRHHDTAGPIKLTEARENKTSEELSNMNPIYSHVLSVIHLLLIAAFSGAFVYLFSGVFEVLFECIPYFFTGLLFFSIFGSSDDDDSGWFETSGHCDD
mgnify:FL=1